MTRAPGRQPVPVVEPEPEGRLEQLLAVYDDAKAEFETAKTRFEGIKDSIKSELASAAPGHTKIVVGSQYLARPLQLSARTEWRLDTRTFKAEQPDLYVRYVRQSTSWRLEAQR